MFYSPMEALGILIHFVDTIHFYLLFSVMMRECLRCQRATEVNMYPSYVLASFPLKF